MLVHKVPDIQIQGYLHISRTVVRLITTYRLICIKRLLKVNHVH
nr:MAG TPA: hypothetical protein [Caudoviricetes sp.]